MWLVDRLLFLLYFILFYSRFIHHLFPFSIQSLFLSFLFLLFLGFLDSHGFLFPLSCFGLFLIWKTRFFFPLFPGFR